VLLLYDIVCEYNHQNKMSFSVTITVTFIPQKCSNFHNVEAQNVLGHRWCHWTLNKELFYCLNSNVHSSIILNKLWICHITNAWPCQINSVYQQSCSCMCLEYNYEHVFKIDVYYKFTRIFWCTLELTNTLYFIGRNSVVVNSLAIRRYWVWLLAVLYMLGAHRDYPFRLGD